MSKIIDWKTKKTIIEDENLTIKELAEKAIKDDISLRRADLICADLICADLSDADLSDADLRRANLRRVKIAENQKEDLLEAMGIRIK